MTADDRDLAVSDPKQSPYCWATAHVMTPDGVQRDFACGRSKHRWGRHRNGYIRWRCAHGCICVRHGRGVS